MFESLIRSRLTLGLVLAMLSGCHSSTELPADLPELPPPPSAPPEPRLYRATSANIVILNATGVALAKSEALITGETAHALVTFKIPDGAPPPKRVHLTIGTKSRRGQSVSYQTVGGKAKQDASGFFQVEFDIKVPEVPGRCLMWAEISHAAFEHDAFVEEEVRLMSPK